MDLGGVFGLIVLSKEIFVAGNFFLKMATLNSMFAKYLNRMMSPVVSLWSTAN